MPWASEMRGEKTLVPRRLAAEPVHYSAEPGSSYTVGAAPNTIVHFGRLRSATNSGTPVGILCARTAGKDLPAWQHRLGRDEHQKKGHEDDYQNFDQTIIPLDSHGGAGRCPMGRCSEEY